MKSTESPTKPKATEDEKFVFTLGAGDFAKLEEAVLSPDSEPNEKLKQAALRYKQRCKST